MKWYFMWALLTRHNWLLSPIFSPIFSTTNKICFEKCSYKLLTYRLLLDHKYFCWKLRRFRTSLFATSFYRLAKFLSRYFVMGKICFLRWVSILLKTCSYIFTIIIISSDLGRDHHHYHCRQHHDRDGMGPIITTTTIIIFITTTTIIIITTTIITNMMIITVSSIMTGTGWDP